MKEPWYSQRKPRLQTTSGTSAKKQARTLYVNLKILQTHRNYGLLKQLSPERKYLCQIKKRIKEYLRKAFVELEVSLIDLLLEPLGQTIV